MVKTTVRIPREVWEAVHHRAIDERADFQELVVKALEAYLKTASKKGGRRP
jgi:hypothetical protein